MTELVSFVKKIADIFLKPQVHRCVIRKKTKRLNFPLDLKM